MISDETVKAAAKELFSLLYPLGNWEDQTPGHQQYYKRRVASILEAAAPYLTERAYNAGHLDGMTGAPNNNPYRSQA